MSTDKPRRPPGTRPSGAPSGTRPTTGRSALQAPAQVRALVSPARQEIVDVLDAAGPCSVAQVAGLLGRPADALYHHLRRLLKVGLVVETERRKEGRHAFAVYDLATRPLQLHRGTAAGSARISGTARSADVVAVIGAAQRLAWRDFRKALVGGKGVTEGPARTLFGARARGWCDAAALERVNRLLGELLDSLRCDGPTDGLVPISLSFLLAPAPPHRRAAAARPDTRQAPSSTMRKKTARQPGRRTPPSKKGKRS